MDKLKVMISKVNKRYLMLMLSGVLCAMLQSTISFAPLAFVSFAPMMYSLCRFKSRRDFAGSFISFFAPYYLYQLVFLLNVYPQLDMNRALAVFLLLLAVIVLTFWESLLMFLPVYLFTYLRRNRIYDALVLAVLIAGGEWLEENIPVLSFPWSAVWLSVTDQPTLLQPANLLGCRTITVLLLTFNGLLAFAATNAKRTLPLTAMAAMLGVWFGYGYFSVASFERLEKNSKSIFAVVAQDEIEGSKKSECTAWECARSYKNILSSAMIEKADLVVFPETAIPMSYDENAGEFSLVKGLAKVCDTTVVNGCFFHFDGDEYNALYAVDSSGSVSEPYFKQVLVPFGEKIPLAFLFDCSTLCECSDEQHTQPLETRLGNIGCVICIESIYPETVRRQSVSGAQILCVCTNDSWFGKSYARKMHFRHSIMRAAENGKYLLRSGNCGISAIIKPTGEVQSVRTQTSKGVVTGQVSLISKRTLYSRIKDLFTVFPAFLAVIAIIKIYGGRQH